MVVRHAIWACRATPNEAAQLRHIASVDSVGVWVGSDGGGECGRLAARVTVQRGDRIQYSWSQSRIFGTTTTDAGLCRR
jgi:hypothetical protein